MHERLHGGENPYTCNYCGKNYSSRMKLLRHETQHTGQKPFTCGYCSKGFTHRQSLLMHERMHTGKQLLDRFFCFAFVGVDYDWNHGVVTFWAIVTVFESLRFWIFKPDSETISHSQVNRTFPFFRRW